MLDSALGHENQLDAMDGNTSDGDLEVLVEIQFTDNLQKKLRRETSAFAVVTVKFISPTLVLSPALAIFAYEQIIFKLSATVAPSTQHVGPKVVVVANGSTMSSFIRICRNGET